MNYQSIYNATYNYFAEENLWPQFISYDPKWEFSTDENIKHAFCLGKRDGILNKQNHKLDNIVNIEETMKKKSKKYII